MSARGESGPVRILHLTDPHLFATAEGTLRTVNTLATLERVLDDVRARQWPAEIVLATGDLSHDEPAGAYELFRAALETLGLPVYCVPGNHDIRDAMQAGLSDPPFHYCRDFETDDWLVLGIDSCADRGAAGIVSDEELDRLRSAIEGARQPHMAVCLHHPPLPMHSRWLDTVGLDNADDFLDIVCSAGSVRTVIFGHVHQAFDELHQGVRVIGTPSTCAQCLPRSDTFALDDRPPAYRRITLLPGGSVDTELIWLEEDE